MSNSGQSKNTRNLTHVEIYINAGNDLVLSLVESCAQRVLDVGCGAGDNARRLRDKNPNIYIVGLTINDAEAELAKAHCTDVRVLDLEHDALNRLGEPFDTILLSHILEHLREPVSVLEKLLLLVKPGGHIIIAVPNVLEWRTRLAFFRGNFNYTNHGILDRTHLRFFTYVTAARELVEPVEGLHLLRTLTRGAAPLGPLRRHCLSVSFRERVDRFAVEQWPNLFGSEIVLLAQKQPIIEASR